MRNTLSLFHVLRGICSRQMLAVLLAFPVFTAISGETFAQEAQTTITGTVTEATSGEPLPGVSIVIQGTSTGTITDMDGNYTISAASSDALVFSFIGYLTEEIVVGSSTTIDVALVEDIIGLDEVVVTGYGVQKKSDVTGSIASVDNETLTEVPVAGVDQALQGRAAGVNITNSGIPGEQATIQIRGITSINGSDPIVVVDGALYQDTRVLTELNANDIESIEILKDASSQAIYGASGGNGVIIITTKKGQEGKMVTSFNAYYGIENPVGKIDMMNSQQWIQTAEEVAANDTAITSMPDTLPTYDWHDYVFEPAATQSYDLSFRGGNERSNYMISTSYYKQEGIIRNSDYRRFTLRVNSEHKINDRLTIDEKLHFVNTERLGFSTSLWNQYYDGPIRPAIQMVPAIPDYLPNGDWANGEDFGLNVTADNPLAKLDMINRTDKTNLFEGNVGARIDIIRGLTLTSRIAGRLSLNDNKEWQEEYFNTTTDRRFPIDEKLLAYMQKNMYYDAQSYLTYDFTVGDKHHISLMAGLEAIQSWGYSYSGERNELPSGAEDLLFFDLSQDNASASQIISGTGYKDRWFSYYGRLTYDYAGKYLLTANVRRDGFSGFGPEKRFGTFPSVSVGWKFSEEAFMQNQNLISFAKVRYGYGQIGSYSKSGAPYLSLVRNPDHFGYAFDNVQSLVGAAPVQIPNPEIHWETVIQSNIGVDLAFLSNRITLTAEYFSKVNDGMLMLQSVPYETGSYSMGADVDGDETNPEVNIGSIKNSGFEFNIGYRKMEGDLKAAFDLNFSTLKNEILDLATDSIRVPEARIHNITDITLNRIGDPVSQFWGWEIAGLYTLDDVERDGNGDPILDNRGRYSIPYTIESGDTVWAPSLAQPGDAKFYDVNGDGEVLTNDDKVILGSPIPKLIFGFSINLEYKGFDMSAFFNGTLGNKIFNGTKQYTYYYQGITNHHTDFANRYVVDDIYKIDPITYEEILVVPQNRNTDLPRNAATNYAKPTSFYIEDGSYLRLRNLTVGYTLPKSLTQKAKIEKLRIYAGARNLFTITKYTGFNPEVTGRTAMDMGIDIGVYPVARMYLFGVNLEF